MARRTTLYQRARSPLIQGRSKSERPLWHASLIGVVLSAAAFAVRFFAPLVQGEPLPAMSVLDWVTAGGSWCLGAVAGAFVGAYVARAWGSRALWISAALAAVVAGFLANQLLVG